MLQDHLLILLMATPAQFIYPNRITSEITFQLLLELLIIGGAVKGRSC